MRVLGATTVTRLKTVVPVATSLAPLPVPDRVPAIPGRPLVWPHRIGRVSRLGRNRARTEPNGGAVTAARGRSAILGSLLPLVACVAAAAASVYAVLAHSFPAVIAPPAAYAAAHVVAARAAAGRTAPGRMALGVVMVAAPLVYAGALSTMDGGDPVGLGIGGFLLLCAMPALLFGRVEPGPRPLTAYAPLVASVCAALLAAAGLVIDPRGAAVLAIGGGYLVLAVLVTAASGAAGPTRFAMGVLWAALSVTGVYLLALTAAGPVVVVLGAVVTAACVAAIGPLRAVLSAERSDGGGRVR